MTTEERDRMNTLCVRIQDEKDYRRFEGLLRELTDVIGQKERRFPQHDGAGKRHQSRPWKTVSGTVHKVISRVYGRHSELVEITIPEAEDLFRELRIENTLTDLGGQVVALKQGAHVDVTFEADAKDTSKEMTDGHA